MMAGVERSHTLVAGKNSVIMTSLPYLELKILKDHVGSPNYDLLAVL